MRVSVQNFFDSVVVRYENRQERDTEGLIEALDDLITQASELAPLPSDIPVLLWPAKSQEACLHHIPRASALKDDDFWAVRLTVRSNIADELIEAYIKDYIKVAAYKVELDDGARAWVWSGFPGAEVFRGDPYAGKIYLEAFKRYQSLGNDTDWLTLDDPFAALFFLTANL